MQSNFNQPYKMGSNFLLISQIMLVFLQVTCGGRIAHLFDSIYQFGDLLMDTGNLITEDPNTLCSNPPYGIDLYDRPTGRCSNGLLIVDFYGTTKGFGLPLLNPYKAEGADFTHGVNFAVGGATALDSTVLAEKNITSTPTTKSSISVQVEWFKDHLRSICSSIFECKKKLARALIMAGEFGANDYNYPLSQGISTYDLYPLVPLVVDSIKNAAQEIIDVGASLLVVPGYFPIGCMPLYRSVFGSNDTAMYDELQCLKHLNEFAVFHNDLLQQALEGLRHLNPSVTIIYGNNYHPFRRLIQNVVSLGFEEDEVFMPCCGKVEDNYNCVVSKGAPWCKDPKKRVFWDGTHPTQETYRLLVDWLLIDMFNVKNSPSCLDLPGNDMSSVVIDAI